MIPAPSSITDSEKEEMVAQISRLINEQEMMPQAKMKKGQKTGKASQLDHHTLAVCAMIVDKLPTEEVWRAWAKEQDSSLHARFFIHAAKPDSPDVSPWTKQNLIPTSCAPKWNDYLIVAGIIELLKAAMTDPCVTHCIVVTESCVPLLRFVDLYRNLLEINGTPTNGTEEVISRPFKTYMSHYDVKSPRCTKFDSQSWFPKLQANGFPSDKSDFLRKALPGWSVLGREDCEGILRVDERAKQMWKIWEGVWAPEEVYLPTAINVHNGMKNVVDRVINFAAWDEKNPDVTKRANPFWFDGRFGEVRNCEE
ncbi:hypothetical protein TL16_g01400 [Triparma laevis f. inornata]|uniref:Uncharacterized protein n=2 Tax=Triparma laevis TaxID=1534972 RepID=A0A9W6ZJM2_9STRA|nr:hypothetical protein TL16_g01400 [Triparma laevis f. inornata]GMH53431.1 hypothetical protein TrLO_g174 [Triparma laevis f. longispina]